MKNNLAILDCITDKVLAYPPNTRITLEKRKKTTAPRVAEFFAGIGLVRMALEQAGFNIVFANDIETSKAALYEANFDSSDFVLGDVREVKGHHIPDIELATASFPCTDLSLAGNRIGLSGEQSGMFWEFARILDEMGSRKPSIVLLENVIGFATSHNGKDLADAIARLNTLGYVCDLFVLNAAWFIPQSRPRMFIVGTIAPVDFESDFTESILRPSWIWSFINSHPELVMHAMPLNPPDPKNKTLADYIERIHYADSRWWDISRQSKFVASLAPIQLERLNTLIKGSRIAWATAYRRTRNGKAVWEIRADALSGCLRTSKGGSSKQAVVEAGHGKIRVRWMTAREYARLQGAPDYNLAEVGENTAMFGFGDAVCVPVVAWIAHSYILPTIKRLHHE